jgi:antitoxin component YwqK of YwqJK toxin-antitoxin module
MEITNDGINYTLFNKLTQKGFRKICFPDGKIKRSINLHNNLRDGQCIEYHPNGNIKMIGSYNLGKVDQELSLYSAEGKLTRVDNYDSNGNLCRITEYYPNGKIHKFSEIKNEKLHGLCKEYYDTGKPHFFRFFEEGFQKGYQYEYHPTGRLKEYTVV